MHEQYLTLKTANGNKNVLFNTDGLLSSPHLDG